jgi:hypothetical protein
MSTYAVDPHFGFVLVRPAGRFTEEAFIELCRAVYDDPDRQPHYSAIWDARGIDELVMDADVIPMYKRFLRENAHRVTQGQVAIVSDRELATTFASMLIEVGRSRVGAFELFETLDAAARWIGIPPQAIADLPAPRRVDAHS